MPPLEFPGAAAGCKIGCSGTAWNLRPPDVRAGRRSRSGRRDAGVIDMRPDTVEVGVEAGVDGPAVREAFPPASLNVFNTTGASAWLLLLQDIR